MLDKKETNVLVLKDVSCCIFITFCILARGTHNRYIYTNESSQISERYNGSPMQKLVALTMQNVSPRQSGTEVTTSTQHCICNT